MLHSLREILTQPIQPTVGGGSKWVAFQRSATLQQQSNERWMAGVRRATDQEITDRLLYIVQDTMGLDAAKAEDMQPTVRALREIQL